jgi:hypothetical protein
VAARRPAAGQVVVGERQENKQRDVQRLFVFLTLVTTTARSASAASTDLLCALRDL